MDVMTLVFYAGICGALGWAGPMLGAPLVRIGIGAAVGIAAATILPVIKGAIGLY